MSSSRWNKSTDNTVFVRFTPPRSDITRFHLQEICSDIGPLKKCSMIRSSDNVGLGYGFCKFVSREDAITAAREYQNKSVEVEGRRYTLTVELASTKQPDEKGASTSQQQKNSSTSQQKNSDKQQQQQQPPQDKSTNTTDKNNEDDEDHDLLWLQTKKKTSRVMVRNLSFHATEHHVRTTLEQEFGHVVEITLPRVDEKLHRGFCFVTFSRVQDAQRAVQPRSTPLLIKKRPVAIDYAVSKHVHQQQKKNVQEQAKHENENDGHDDGDSSASDEEQMDVDSEEEEEEASDKSDDGAQDHDANDGSGSDDDDDDDDGSDDESDESESNPVDEPKQPPPKHDDAVNQHKSLFVRNLPFDATRHDLFQLFQTFGHIESIYLVKDKKTSVQKGTAFVSFQSKASAERALEAAGSSGFVAQPSTTSTTHGLHLRGRRLFVNVAVDKQTAASLTVEKQGNKVTGKDRRNLYLKMEGRVANEADGNSSGSSNAWEHLPESDQLKRQRAFAEKNTKLRSPLFFINANRLSVRNLAKHVDEADFKKLCVDATKRGLDTNLVTQEDQVAHWRASGEMTTRDIMKRIEQAKEESGSVIPVFDEKNVKRCIPSVYIDRDFTTNKKEKAPSRGFGFVDFEHHAHALACLRELNNNPYYAAEFVSGGKKAVDAKRVARKRKGKGEAVTGEFVSENGRVLTPRLIVDFTVENKAKAKKQAEHRVQQQANIEKQRIEQKEKKVAEGPSKKQQKKKSRGAAQREKKRRQRESGETQDDSVPIKETKTQKQSTHIKNEAPTRQKVKAVKPPKKKRKVDEEEQNFENLVDSYRKTFSGVSELKEGADIEVKVQSRPKKKERRWFE